MTEPDKRVTRLTYYPIKSCRGIEGSDLAFGDRGFHLDRRFMVVDGVGSAITQGKHPRLTRVIPTFNDGVLALAGPGISELAIPLDAAAEGRRSRVQVWEYSGPAADQGEEAAAWFTEVLGEPARLAYMPDDVQRPSDPENATSMGNIVGFADVYPFLLTATASLGELHEHMDETVPMDRFRANIVVETQEPWEEDAWRELRIGDARFAVVADCTRCVITTTDQATGERFREPLRALGRQRKVPGGVAFGRYLVPLSGARVRLDDPVRPVA